MRCSFTSQLEHVLEVSPVQKLGCQSNTYFRDRWAASVYAVFLFEESQRESVVGWGSLLLSSRVTTCLTCKSSTHFNLMITLSQPLHGLHWVHLGQGRHWDAHLSEAQGQSLSFPLWRGHPYFLPCDLFYPSPEPVPLCRISLIIICTYLCDRIPVGKAASLQAYISQLDPFGSYRIIFHLRVVSHHTSKIPLPCKVLYSQYQN